MITNKTKQFISLVIYLHNNELEIKQFLSTIMNVSKEHFENYEIILVNDSSDDLSVQYAREFFNNYESANNGNKPAVTIINTSNYHGIEIAMNAGTDLAIGDFIIEFDVIDDSINESLIFEVYQKAISGYDIVSAVPKKSYSLLSRIFYKIYNTGTGKDIIPITSEGFRVISRRALNRVKATHNHVIYRKALYAQCGFPSSRVFYKGKHGIKKVSFSNRINLAIDSLILFTDIIQKISLFICLAFVAFAIIVGIYITIVFFGEHRPVAGYTPMMGFLSVGFSGVFFLITIILKFLSVILNTVFVKQRYIVESIEKI